MPIDLISVQDYHFLINIGLSLLYGIITGVERELKSKPAGIATHCFVIGAAMIFTHLSRLMLPEEPTRIAAQIVSGVGFLGAGIIIRAEGGKIENLTTAASVWYSAAIGMALGYHYHLIAFVATVYGALVPRLPNVRPPQR